jgi:RNA 3'-terminal phosphate cyclase (ATP)
MTDSLIIDGSRGEGGGQIVRSCLALSILTGKPVRIENMRARRNKAGLRNQHLTAVKAAAEICRAEVHGAALGSSTLDFRPGPARSGRYQFDVGTAGSISLVLQTILPPLLLAEEPSEVIFIGGTHNPGAPIFEFVKRVYLPLINRMGPQVDVQLQRHGFYPAGGGRVVARIQPAPFLKGFDLLERGQIVCTSVTALIANLPEHIATREVDTVITELGWDRLCGTVVPISAHGPGNAVWAEIESAQVTELFASFGRLGVRAEQVGEEVSAEVAAYLDLGAPIGPYLADQLLLPLAISAWRQAACEKVGGGSYLTGPLTEHTDTHSEIVRQFLPVGIIPEPSNGGLTKVTVRPL